MCYDILSKTDSMARDCSNLLFLYHVICHVVCYLSELKRSVCDDMQFAFLTDTCLQHQCTKKHAWQVLVTDKGTASFKMQQSNLRENVMLYTCTESMAHKITDLKSLSLSPIPLLSDSK